MFNAKTLNDFISLEDCKYIIDKAVDSNLWESGGNEFWENRVINYSNLINFDNRAASILLDANKRCNKFIKDEFKLDKEIYSDTLQVVRWFDGMSQPPHADDMTNTIVSGFEHRAFGSIIYLNDDYLGGRTYYPNFNKEIIPEVGKLAVHPGNPEHLHGVTQIKNNTRYTIASFWTFNKERSYEWPIS